MYQTPSDFLHAVQDFLAAQPYPKGESDVTFTQLNLEEFKQHTSLHKYTPDEIRGGQLLVDGLLDIIKGGLDEESVGKIESSIAFGKALNGEFNALCVRNDDGQYAVLIYEGLMTLMHKYDKFIVASTSPESVTFCNRANLQELKGSDYIAFADELIVNYKLTHSPMGALIKLAPNAAAGAGINTHLKELFVLCHELGHFFNGDLESTQNFHTLANTQWLVFDDNKSHEREYKADLTGFSIFEKAVSYKYKDFPKNLLISVLAQVFDLMSMIDSESSDTHPAPMNRLKNVVTVNFGAEAAAALMAMYTKKED
jgi:hypothetical protein